MASKKMVELVHEWNQFLLVKISIKLGSGKS